MSLLSKTHCVPEHSTISSVNHSHRQSTYIHPKKSVSGLGAAADSFGVFVYMGCTGWPAFPPTVVLRRTNSAFGVYFVWQHLGLIAHCLCQSFWTFSCLGLNLKSKFFLLITTLVPDREKRVLSQHQVQSLAVLLQLVYSVSEGLSTVPAVGKLSR